MHKKSSENPNTALSSCPSASTLNHVDSYQKGANPSTHLAPEVKFNGRFDFFSLLTSTPAEREGLLTTQKAAEKEKETELRKKYRERSAIWAHLTFEEFKANEERHEQSLLEAQKEVEEERDKRRKERQAIIKQRKAERANPQ